METAAAFPQQPSPVGGAMSEKLELAKLLLDDYKHRGESFWKLAFRAMIAIVSLDAIPFLHFDAIRHFTDERTLMFAFPIASAIMTIVSAVILAAVNERYKRVGFVYRELMKSIIEDAGLKQTYHLRNRVFAFSVGTTVCWMFRLFFLSISAFVTYLLWSR